MHRKACIRLLCNRPCQVSMPGTGKCNETHYTECTAACMLLLVSYQYPSVKNARLQSVVNMTTCSARRLHKSSYLTFCTVHTSGFYKMCMKKHLGSPQRPFYASNASQDLLYERSKCTLTSLQRRLYGEEESEKQRNPPVSHLAPKCTGPPRISWFYSPRANYHFKNVSKK